MNDAFYLIILPVTAGLLGFAIKRLRSELDFLGFLLALYFALRIFIFTRTNTMAFTITSVGGIELRFYLDSLTGFIILLNSVLAFLVWFYSLRAMSKTPKENIYSLYIVGTLVVSNTIVLCGNLLFLLVMWVIFTVFLNALLLIGKKDSSAAAKTAALTMGISDLFIMVGFILLLVNLGGRGNFPLETRLSLGSTSVLLSFAAIVIGTIAKLGVMPSTSWITKSSTTVPASTMALVPASLSRLLGTYLMIRMAFFLFDLSDATTIKFILIAIGAVTVIIATIYSLEQKDVMTVISFYTIVQSGYILIGIGAAVPIAVAGSLFHLFNSAVCQTCLFLTMGSVEYRTKTTQFNDLGGLGSKMPLTMLSFIIAALAVSDFPMLSSFYSKWMICQGVFEVSRQTWLWVPLFFVLMFSSVLIFVSILKTIDLVFLRESRKKLEKVYETRFEMVATTLVLSALCIVFGIFAKHFFLDKFIYPSLPFSIPWFDFWSPFSASNMIIAAILLGALLFIYCKMHSKEPAIKAAFALGGSHAKT